MAATYILQGREAILEGDLIAWEAWFENADRVVKKTELADGIEVSTVFLGFNYQFGSGVPLLFETMVFGGARDLDCERYSTWEEALSGHENMVRELVGP